MDDVVICSPLRTPGGTQLLDRLDLIKLNEAAP